MLETMIWYGKISLDVGRKECWHRGLCCHHHHHHDHHHMHVHFLVLISLRYTSIFKCLRMRNCTTVKCYKRSNFFCYLFCISMQENSVFQYLFRMCTLYINASSEEFKTKQELRSSVHLICRFLCHDVSWWIITCKAITIKLSTWGF
jgi:hypothetical protein